MASLGIWIRELRLEFLTGSATPVLLGTSVAWHETGKWDPFLFALTLMGAVFLHLGANTANDYFDHLSGNDAANLEYVRPFTGGSRLIQEGRISPETVLTTSLCFFAAALAIGIILTFIAGPAIILFGLIGSICGYFYTAPPLKLAHRGFGELAIGTSFGLIAPGSYFVQTGMVSFSCILASLPVTFLITAVIVINEFQDRKADSSVDKNTMVVKHGRKKSVYFFSVLIVISYLPIIAGAAIGMLHPFTLLALVTLPLGVRSISVAARNYNSPRMLAPANASTVANHLLTGIIITVVYLVTG